MNHIAPLFIARPPPNPILKVLPPSRPKRHLQHVRLPSFLFNVHHFLHEANLRRPSLWLLLLRRRPFPINLLSRRRRSSPARKPRPPPHNLDPIRSDQRVIVRVLRKRGISRLRGILFVAAGEMHVCADHVGPFAAEDVVAVRHKRVFAVQFHDLQALRVLEVLCFGGRVVVVVVVVVVFLVCGHYFCVGWGGGLCGFGVVCWGCCACCACGGGAGGPAARLAKGSVVGGEVDVDVECLESQSARA
jgi:hypothetical protein